MERTDKIYMAGITMCQDYNIQYSSRFISLMPTNLYGVSI